MNNDFLKMKISGKINKFPPVYTVYHLIKDNETVFAGCCIYNYLFQTPDAKRNSLFTSFFPMNTPCQIVVIGIFDKYYDACRIQVEEIAKFQPAMNMLGSPTTIKTPVQCVETGEIFESLTAAAEAHKIQKSILSKHLTNKPGFKTIQGKTYIKVLELNKPLKTAQKIQCVETGEIFDSAIKLAKILNITPAAVYNYFKFNHKKLKNKHYIKINI